MNQMPIILIAHNIRSAYNVGSLFRSCDGAGIEKIVLTGITPYPKVENDTRLPYIAARAESAIAKTALGAETTVPFEYSDDPHTAVARLKGTGYKIYALEQTSKATSLFGAELMFPAVVILGEELGGVGKDLLALADEAIEIPMHGTKDSLNVSTAAAVALFWMREEYEKRAT